MPRVARFDDQLAAAPLDPRIAQPDDVVVVAIFLAAHRLQEPDKLFIDYRMDLESKALQMNSMAGHLIARALIAPAEIGPRWNDHLYCYKRNDCLY